MCNTDSAMELSLIRRSSRQRVVRSASELLGKMQHSSVRIVPSGKNLQNCNTEMSNTLCEQRVKTLCDKQLLADLAINNTQTEHLQQLTCSTLQPVTNKSIDTSTNAELVVETVTSDAEQSQSLLPVTSDDLLLTNRSETGRAVPLPHVILDSQLQSFINNLEPKDLIDDHIVYKPTGGQTNRSSMFCKYCGLWIRHLHHFRKHIRLHPEVDYRPYQCPVCDYKAQVRGQIARHINIHSNNKPFVCTECGRGFNFRQKIHMKYHADVRDEQCPVCLLSFHEYKTLKNHIVKIHGINNVQEFLGRKVVPTRYNNRQLRADIINSDQPNNQCASSEEANTVDVGVVSTVPCVSTEGVAAESCDNSSDTSQPHMTASATPRAAVCRLVTTDAASTVDEQLLAVADELVDIVENDVITIDGINYKAHVISSTDTALQTLTSEVDLVTNDCTPQLAVHSNSQQRQRRRVGNYGTNKIRIQTDRFKSNLCSKLSDDVVLPTKQECATNKFLKTDEILETFQHFCTITVQHAEQNGKVSYVCKLCTGSSEVVFPSKTQFAIHLECNHPDVKAWRCSQCNYTCRLRTSLVVHRKRHVVQQKHICHVCGCGFAFKQKFMSHLRRHLNEREFKCDICQKTFNELSHVRRHIERVHVEGLPYVCHVCDRGFKDDSSLHQHLETHYSIKRFYCDTCCRFYKSRLSFAQHKKFHNSVFQCDLCDKHFTSYSGFMSHKTMHTDSADGYQCTKCNKVLLTKGSLNRHNKVVHSNVRPHTCKICSKAFKTKKDLQSHNVVHEAEKHYQCFQCSFQCKRLQSLHVHMRTHETVKPYQCIICHKEYTQKQSLEIHHSRHAAKLPTRYRCEPAQLGNSIERVDLVEDVKPRIIYIDDKQLLPSNSHPVYNDANKLLIEPVVEPTLEPALEPVMVIDAVEVNSNSTAVVETVCDNLLDSVNTATDGLFVLDNDDECVYDVVTVEISDCDTAVINS